MRNAALPIRGLIFDLDGTLVDSRLDFDLMRREMNLPPRMPILEAISALPADRAAACRSILERHELAGAARARAFPGAESLLAELAARGFKLSIFTRNSRRATFRTLQAIHAAFDPIVTREDGPPKPDPTAIWKICTAWGLPHEQVAVIGDYYFDIEAGRKAGTRTVLYSRETRPEWEHESAEPDFFLNCYLQADPFLAWLAQPT